MYYINKYPRKEKEYLSKNIQKEKEYLGKKHYTNRFNLQDLINEVGFKRLNYKV